MRISSDALRWGEFGLSDACAWLENGQLSLFSRSFKNEVLLDSYFGTACIISFCGCMFSISRTGCVSLNMSDLVPRWTSI